MTKALGISPNLSTAFHPQTDGQTERANATLEHYLWVYRNYQQDDCERLLPIAEFCCNNTQTGTTKITPYFTNYGYHPRFLPDLGTRNDETPEVSEYVEALSELHEDLRAEIKDAQMAQTEQAVTLGLSRNRSVGRIKGNQATFNNSQWNNLRSCVWV